MDNKRWNNLETVWRLGFNPHGPPLLDGRKAEAVPTEIVFFKKTYYGKYEFIECQVRVTPTEFMLFTSARVGTGEDLFSYSDVISKKTVRGLMRAAPEAVRRHVLQYMEGVEEEYSQEDYKEIVQFLKDLSFTQRPRYFYS